MPLPEIPDHMYVQATFQRGDGDEVVNTFCFRNHRNVVGESFTDLALRESMRDLLDSFYGTGASLAGTVGAWLHPQLFGLKYTIYDLGQPTGGSVEIDSATFRTAAGGSTGWLPPDLAVVITWRTALRGRSYRGRTYLGPLHSSAHDNSRVSSSFLSAIATAAPKLIGAPDTRDWEIHVLSRTVPTATPVIGADVDNEFDTQRRRGHNSAPRTLITAP